MSRKILYVFYLLMMSCSVFQPASTLFRNDIDFITINTNIIVNTDIFVNTKIKTKIKVYPDSIVASVIPFLGIELTNIKMMDDVIIINNKLKNDISIINTADFDSEFKLKKFQKLFIQLKKHKDDEMYKTKHVNYVLTNYSSVSIGPGLEEDVFMPTKILLDQKENMSWLGKINQVELEYKSVRLNKY